MADTAARLVDNALPRVPVRQFVLSFPYEIRYRLAWDGELIAAVLKVFLRVVGRWCRRQALGHSDGRCGSVTFVQRFGSSLNVNPHIHVLFLDGVYVDGDEGPEFIAAAKLGDDDVQQIVETTARRFIRLCTKRGFIDDAQIDTPGRRRARSGRHHRRIRARLHRHRGARPALAAGRLRIRDDGQLSSRSRRPGPTALPTCCCPPRAARETGCPRTPATAQPDFYHGILAANA